MIPSAFQDASLARRKLKHVAHPIPGEPRRGAGAGRVDGVLDIVALLKHLLEPGRRIGGEEQALPASVPKIDIVEQREPAEAEFAHGRINGVFQIAELSSTRTFLCETREVVQASSEERRVGEECVSPCRYG